VREVFSRPAVWWLVVLLVASAALVGETHTNRLTRDPVLYAALSRQMAEGGDFFVPRLGDEVYLTKPPLMFWLSAGMMKVMGPVGFAARFPSALLGVISVLLTYRLARRLWDRETAFLAVVILATTYTFLRSGRTFRLETVVTATTLGALLVYLGGADRDRFPRWGGLAFFALMGIGVLGKGYAGLLPLALVLVAAPRRKALLSPWFWGGAVSFVVLVGGWLLLVQREIGADWTLAFGADVAEYGASEGWFALYLKKIPWGFVKKNFVWAPFIVVGAFLAVRDLRRGDRVARRRAWLLLAWVLVICVSVLGKAYPFTRYLAPACPALAILAAVPIRGWMRDVDFSKVVAFTGCAVVAVALALLLLPIPTTGGPHRFEGAAAAVDGLRPAGEPLPFVGDLSRTRKAEVIYYFGREPEEAPSARAAALRGTGRVALVEDDCREWLPRGVVLEVVHAGDGYVLARIR